MGGRDEIVDQAIGMIGVVMNQHELAHPGQVRKLHGMGDAAVAPAHALAVLLVGVLPVVDQDVHVPRESVAR